MALLYLMNPQLFRCESSVRFSCSLFFAICSSLVCFNIAAQNQSLDQQIDELTRQVQIARQQGDMGRADSLAAQMLTLSNQRDLPAVHADALYEQARNAMERNQYIEAQSLLNNSIELYQGLNDRKGLANAYRQMGLTYRYQSNYSQALEYIYLAMQINQQLGDKEAISSTHNSIGVVLEKMGQYEEASQAHQSALEINYELGDQEGVASALYNLGDIRRSMGDDELALTYFRDALKLDIESGDVKNIAYSHHKIGYVLLIQGKYEEARTHILEALERFELIETPRDTDWAKTSLAHLEMELGNFERAQELIDGVIARGSANQYNSLLVDAYKVAAELAFRKGDYALALAHVEAGLSLAKSNKERHQEGLLEKLRVKVLVEQDSLKEAIEAMQRQKEIDDEILNAKRLSAIANVQAQSEFVRRAHQIELLEKEKALQQVQIEQEKILLNSYIAVGVGGALLLIMLYGRFVQRRLNLKLEAEVAERTLELEEKNTELTHAYREMEAISLTDKLTGIKNRRFLENQINADLEQSQRQYQNWQRGKSALPKQADIVLFLIDMDNFKEVNDTFGHEAGDKVLIQLTERMNQVFRQSDYVVRWGGEEFVGVARFVDRKVAPALAKRMVEIVNEKPFQLTDNESNTLTCSIGFAAFPLMQEESVDMHWNGLVCLADVCLYAAKYSGKDSWVGAEKIFDKSLDLDDISPTRLSNWQKDGKIKILSSFALPEQIKWQSR